MVDPYAPPGSAPHGRPVPYETPPATTSYSGGQAVSQTYEPPASSEPPRRRWRHDRFAREAHEATTAEPAHLGLFWGLAGIGIGLLCLTRLMLFFAVSGGLPGNQVAAGLFGVLGLIVLSAGLACAAILQRGLATPWRIALILGAGFFAVVGLGIGLPTALPL